MGGTELWSPSYTTVEDTGLAAASLACTYPPNYACPVIPVSARIVAPINSACTRDPMIWVLLW